MSERSDEERLIILFLGGIAAVCIGGIIVLEALAGGAKSEALLTIGSLSVGALAGRISAKGESGRSHHDGDGETDAFEIIGRAATKRLIEDALRKLDPS